MELVKDIYFNTDKLVENTKVKVSYTGKFYQGNNDKVFIHYGYGENWNNINETEMVKTELGYQTELDLQGKDTLNFCFKNQNNEWDNNCGKNYIFNITPIDVATPVLDNIVEPIVENENIVNPVQQNFQQVVNTPVVNNNKYSEINNNAIAVVNTGFQKTMVWTKKFGANVCKFFSSVPKFISGNYKRLVDNKK